MTRAGGAAVAVASAVVLLAGCDPELVELPVDRRPAVVVQLGQGPLRCPADTVGIGDYSGESGAGAVPADFDGRTVLRCVVGSTTGEQFPVDQWGATVTPELLGAFNLPDRQLRPQVPCAAATGSSDAVYLVDSRRRAVRVLLPYDDPCRRMRTEVQALLPGREPPADVRFSARPGAR